MIGGMDFNTWKTPYCIVAERCTLSGVALVQGREPVRPTFKLTRNCNGTSRLFLRFLWFVPLWPIAMIPDHTSGSTNCCETLMKIHEYQGKDLFRAAGIPVPRGIVCKSAGEVSAAYTELGGSLAVVKSQIHAGGRGKGRFKEFPDQAGVVLFR
jgi:hypothetical protein